MLKDTQCLVAQQTATLEEADWKLNRHLFDNVKATKAATVTVVLTIEVVSEISEKVLADL